MTTVIVANGEIRDRKAAIDWLQRAELVIAANGGCRRCLEMGFPPDVLIGDLDSVTESELEAVRSAGGSVQRHPTRKDATDLELALLHAQNVEDRQIVILGAMGGRWDQSLASFLLLANPDLEGPDIQIVDGGQRAFLLRPGAPTMLEGPAGSTVSLLPLGGDAEGITTEGLEYALSGDTLHFGTTRGVSNILHVPPGRIELTSGLLLVLIQAPERSSAL